VGISIALIVFGLILLTVGAEGLVRAGSSLALRMGVTPLVVGLTIVAVGTSSPELVVSAEAALYGNSAIALGNVVGSNIGNIAVILGIAALVCPMKARTEIIQREMPVMIAVSALLWILVLDGEVGRLDGLLLFLGSIAYIYFVYSIARRNKSREVDDEFSEAVGPAITANMAGRCDACRRPDIACGRCQTPHYRCAGYRGFLQGQ
jgi:cation:H+ antiporter